MGTVRRNHPEREVHSRLQGAVEAQLRRLTTVLEEFWKLDPNDTHEQERARRRKLWGAQAYNKSWWDLIAMDCKAYLSALKEFDLRVPPLKGRIDP